ncbi:MAG: hypothetical protein JNJ50_30895 [Acidobacteria bacterium]|nr:hypothetical protein [Acidobacteriota bacterium]
MNPPFAIEYLTCRFISPQQAVNRLGDLDEAAAVLKIYHRFFPQEFVAGRRRVISRAGDLQAALVECLGLVSKHLFEIPDYCFDGWQNEDLPLSYIPIEPIFGEWWNDDIEELMPLWQVLLILIGAWEPGDTENKLFRTAANAQQQWQDKVIDCDRLARLCRRVSEPLCWLNLALLTLDHNTGNPWLDASYECPITGVEWTTRNVRCLRKNWLEAQQACQQIAQLDAWLGRDVAHLQQFLDLWMQALTLRQRNKGY